MCVLTSIFEQRVVHGDAQTQRHRQQGQCTWSTYLVTFATQHVSKHGNKHTEEKTGLCKHTSQRHRDLAGNTGGLLVWAPAPAGPPVVICPRPCPNSFSLSPRTESLQIFWATCSSVLSTPEQSSVSGIHTQWGDPLWASFQRTHSSQLLLIWQKLQSLNHLSSNPLPSPVAPHLSCPGEARTEHNTPDMLMSTNPECLRNCQGRQYQQQTGRHFGFEYNPPKPGNFLLIAFLLWCDSWRASGVEEFGDREKGKGTATWSCTGLWSMAAHHSQALKTGLRQARTKQQILDQYLQDVFKHYLSSTTRRVSSHVNSSLPRVPPHAKSYI